MPLSIPHALSPTAMPQSFNCPPLSDQGKMVCHLSMHALISHIYMEAIRISLDSQWYIYLCTFQTIYGIHVCGGICLYYRSTSEDNFLAPMIVHSNSNDESRRVSKCLHKLVRGEDIPSTTPLTAFSRRVRCSTRRLSDVPSE